MDVKKINKNEIIEEILQAGYERGQLIDYGILKKLLVQFGKGLKEEDFAQRILEISTNNYSRCKNKGSKVRILNVPKKILTEEERQEIIQEILNEGYKSEQLVNYDEIKELSKRFGRGLKDVEFAQKVLGVKDSNYSICKNKGTKVRILKGTEKIIIEEERQEIIQDIINAGYKFGQSINYDELQELSKRFGRGLREVDFAQKILGVTYSNYSICKNKGTKVRILKGTEKTITEEERQEIIQEIINEGYKSEQLVNYDEIKELSKRFGRGLKDVEFAQKVLGVKDSNYSICKNKGTKVRILKGTEKIIIEEERQEIIQDIINAGYKFGQSINYDELQELSKRFGRGLRDSEFAQKILGISRSSYNMCKNKGRKVLILKESEKIVSEEERQEIIQEIINAGYKFGQSINYDELQELSKRFGRGLKDVEFAQKILGVTYSNYSRCKSIRKNVKILKEKENKITEEERKEIVQEIINAGYKSRQSINFDEILELSKRFGRGLRDSEFAQKILGISRSSYNMCKNKGRKVLILKESEKIVSEEERQEIIQEIINAGYKFGQSINYDELQELNKRFGRGLKEVEFAQKILGFTYSNYRACKCKEQKILIKDGIKLEKSKEIIALYTPTSQFYSKGFIEKICKEYDLTIDDFITYVYIKKFYDNELFINALNKNKGLWIGKKRMSEEYVEKNIIRIENIASQTATYLCNRYGIKQKIEDYIQDLIIYIIENMGELETNLGDTAKCFDIIRGKAKKYLEYEVLNELKISQRFEGFYKKPRMGKEDREFEVQYEDKSINIQEKVEAEIESKKNHENEDEMDRCINLLKNYLEEGMSRNEAISKVSKDIRIDSKTMIEYMQKYLLERGKVKITKESGIILGVPSSSSEEPDR